MPAPLRPFCRSFLISAVVVAACACQDVSAKPTPASASPPPTKTASPPTTPMTTTTTTKANDAAVVFAQDLVVNLAGEEVGTMSSLDRREKDGSTTLRRSADLTIRRGATVTSLKTVTVVTLDPGGAPTHYRFEKTDPAGTLVADGVVNDARTKLTLITSQNGARVTTSIDLPKDFTFAVALEHEVRSALKDGRSIERPVILEELGALVQMKTTVKKAPEGFIISATFQSFTTDETVDPQGRTLVARTPAAGIVAYPWGHAPKDIKALLKGEAKADLLAVSTWKVKSVPAGATRVVYRISTPDADSFMVPEDARQKILRLDAKSVVVEVTSGPSSTTPLSAEAKAKALSATPYEAVNDPRIQKAAKDARGDARKPDEVVRRLSDFVYKHVQKKGLDRGYAPAIATLESRAGDCTEHSVLMSALLRASGIPTRLVDGVVVDGENAGYHEWVEVDLGAGFVAVDPTFNAWPAGPQRLKLAQGSTLPDEHLGLSLAAARLLQSGVKLEVLEVEY